MMLKALGVAKGLEYMHNLNFVHSDLKPVSGNLSHPRRRITPTDMSQDNILIGEDCTPLICDFGISRMLDSSQSNFVSTTHDGQIKGSARWMAIELYSATGETEPIHTKETDVWAFGMTLYVSLSHVAPIND